MFALHEKGRAMFGDAVTLEREIRSLINLTSPEFEDTQRLVLTLGKKTTTEVKVVNLIEWLLH